MSNSDARAHEGREHEAAGRGASLSELMDILDDSCFDGDICEFLQDNTMPYQ